jgi:hypothetical protein
MNQRTNIRTSQFHAIRVPGCAWIEWRTRGKGRFGMTPYRAAPRACDTALAAYGSARSFASALSDRYVTVVHRRALDRPPE